MIHLIEKSCKITNHSTFLLLTLFIGLVFLFTYQITANDFRIEEFAVCIIAELSLYSIIAALAHNGLTDKARFIIVAQRQIIHRIDAHPNDFATTLAAHVIIQSYVTTGSAGARRQDIG